MGLLGTDYYTDKVKQANPVIQKSTPQDPVAPAPQPQVQAPQQGGAVSDFVFGGSGPLTVPGVANSTPAIAGGGPTIEEKLADKFSETEITSAQQTKRFGGEVGSSEYYNFKAEHPMLSFLPQQIGSSLGMRFPDQETWDKMSRVEQVAYSTAAAGSAAVRMVKELPKEIVRAPFRVAGTIVAPWTDMATGGAGTSQSIAETEPIKLPWIGSVPTYFHTYEEARKDSSLGPVGATLMTVGLAAGDVSIVGSVGEVAAAAFKPKAKVKFETGKPIHDVAPINQALVKGEADLASTIVNKNPSLNEYYAVPRDVIKKNFKGSPNNTFLKVTPMAEDAVEVAVVQIRSGTIPKSIDYVKNKFGAADKIYKGDFGNEVKLQSQTVKLKEPTFGFKSEFADDAALQSIPPKPLKGFENLGVTENQIGHLQQIGKVNGLEVGVRDAVIRTVTGKKGVGELTQAEYVRAAQALGSMKNLNKYAPELENLNLFAQYGSPQRHWMRNFEERSGVPLYSEVYVPLEEAVRVRDVFRNSMRNEARDVFGKYAKQGFGEERRLISAYMRGETEAITANKSLSAATKKELIEVSTKMRELYDRVGPQVDVPTEIFLKDYQPSVQEIGGVYQLYKEGASIPKEIEFFAKFKKHGNVGIQVDDALALWDIYTNAGSNRAFLNPALERIGNVSSKISTEVQTSVKSYVLEKLGYAGNLERSLDRMATEINRKLGTNLPPDAARQMTSLVMDTTYSGALGANPGKAVRNLIQNDIMTYPRLGPRFYGEAFKKAFDKAAIEEVRSKGFLVELGVPYGEELAKDITIGGRAGNSYRKVTQATLGPYSMADQVNRVRTYWQVKLQFEDAIGKYNSGKIGWTQVEKELDFGALSPVDRNIIRQRLTSGDTEGAFNNLVREVIDETHFPYRRGSSSRITYGLGGKIGTQFLQWPIEFAHTHARWIRTGQYDKLIRSYAASSVIARSIKDSTGLDFEKDVFYNPLRPGFSPAVRFGIDTMEWIDGMLQGNLDQVEENKEEMARAVRSLAIPAGAQIENVRNFIKSYFPNEKGPVPTGGPIGPNGNYPVYDRSGKLLYYAEFKDIWMQLWGFRTAAEEENRDLLNKMRNANFTQQKAKEEVLRLYQQEKYDQANEIIAEYGINVGPRDFDKYLIPLSERTYNQIPATLKAQFAPKVFK